MLKFNPTLHRIPDQTLFIGMNKQYKVYKLTTKKQKLSIASRFNKQFSSSHLNILKGKIVRGAKSFN